MADHNHIVPFIRKAEGGWVNDPDDAGGETNAGITYKTWCSHFGATHDRFLAMSDGDWAVCFKTYWDSIFGDLIQSQRIADTLVDWVWGSGSHYPSIDLQDILIHGFGAHIAEDGAVGPATIASANAADEAQLYAAIISKRFEYLEDIVAAHPTNAKFLNGWKNRMNALVAFEEAN